MKKSFQKCKEIVLFIIPAVILFCMCIFYIKKNNMIKIVGDEYGYWAAGAFFSGLDWSEVTAYNSYYGYGYGIILSIILKLQLPSTLSYQIGIILNAFFLIGIYFVIIKLLDELLKNRISNIQKIVIAFCCSTFTGNFYYTQYTLTEVLQALVYWGLILVAYKLLQKITIWRSLLFILLALYSFAIHQRAIGITFICALFWIILIVRNKSKKLICTSVVFGIAILFMIFFVKWLYQEIYFSGGVGTKFQINNFSGQVSKIEFLFSFSGIWMFIKAYVGKIYYALSGTYLLGGVAGGKIILLLFDKIKKKEKIYDNKLLILGIFMLANTAIMMAIGSIYMIDYYGRFDFLVYGRYFAFTLSPLCFLGILFLIKNRMKKSDAFFYISIVAIYIVVSCLIDYIINYENNVSTHLFYSCPDIADIFIWNNYQKHSILLVTCKEIAVFLVIIVTFNIYKQSKIIKECSLIGIAVLNILSSLYVYKNGCLSWAENQNRLETELAKYIEKKEISDELYYYVKENTIQIDYLQFLLKDESIHCFIDPDEVFDDDRIRVILTVKNSEIASQLSEIGYNITCSSNVLDLWEMK